MGLRASEVIGSERATARRTQPIDPVGFRPSEGHRRPRYAAQMAATPTAIKKRGACGVILNQQQPSRQYNETARGDGLRDKGSRTWTQTIYFLRAPRKLLSGLDSGGIMAMITQ